MLALLLLFAGSVVLAQVRPAQSPLELTLANLPAQKIGANDLIAISVYDAPEFTRTLRVGRQVNQPSFEYGWKPSPR